MTTVLNFIANNWVTIVVGWVSLIGIFYVWMVAATAKGK